MNSCFWQLTCRRRSLRIRTTRRQTHFKAGRVFAALLHPPDQVEQAKPAIELPLLGPRRQTSEPYAKDARNLLAKSLDCALPSFKVKHKQTVDDGTHFSPQSAASLVSPLGCSSSLNLPTFAHPVTQTAPRPITFAFSSAFSYAIFHASTVGLASPISLALLHTFSSPSFLLFSSSLLLFLPYFILFAHFAILISSFLRF